MLGLILILCRLRELIVRRSYLTSGTSTSCRVPTHPQWKEVIRSLSSTWTLEIWLITSAFNQFRSVLLLTDRLPRWESSLWTKLKCRESILLTQIGSRFLSPTLPLLQLDRQLALFWTILSWFSAGKAELSLFLSKQTLRKTRQKLLNRRQLLEKEQDLAKVPTQSSRSSTIRF